MTQSPIEPPNNSDPRPEETPSASSNRPLGFDEMVAVLVAFLSLGSVLFWGLTRGGVDSIFSEPTASGRAGVEEVRPPIAFGSGDDSEDVGAVAVPRSADDRAVRPSARAELAERAALRREREREVEGVVGSERSGSVWNDFRTGAAGTAAGVAGVAADFWRGRGFARI